jgi:hypothetical protein
MALHCYYQKISGLFIILSLMNVNFVQSTLSEKLRTLSVDTKDPRNDPCNSAPAGFCKNNGICYLDTINDPYACHCQYPYVGYHCDELSECYGYCMNGRPCTSSPDGSNPTCDCGSEWTGRRCQKRVIATTVATVPPITPPSSACIRSGPNFCNSGTCVEINNQAQCKCPPTQTGTRCEISTEVTQTTTPSPSGPLTTTTLETTSPSGPIVTTTTEPATCSQQPCKNGSRCYPNGNSVFCLCVSRHTGARCETPL